MKHESVSMDSMRIQIPALDFELIPAVLNTLKTMLVSRNVITLRAITIIAHAFLVLRTVPHVLPQSALHATFLLKQLLCVDTGEYLQRIHIHNIRAVARLRLNKI